MSCEHRRMKEGESVRVRLETGCMFCELALLRTRLAAAERERESQEDKEAARWQERIADIITRSGLEPFDASGNESGDPLDWTADQVEHALAEMAEKLADAESKLAVAVEALRTCARYGPGTGTAAQALARIEAMGKEMAR